jgi:hypothetical protein
LRLSQQTRRKCASENQREKEGSAAHKRLDAGTAARDAGGPQTLMARKLPEKGHHYR